MDQGMNEHNPLLADRIWKICPPMEDPYSVSEPKSKLLGRAEIFMPIASIFNDET